MPRKPKEEKHKGVFERVKGSGLWWCRWVDTDGRRVTRMIGSLSNAKLFYQRQKVRVADGITSPVPTLRGVKYSQLVDDALVYSKAEHRDTRTFAARIEVTRAEFGNRIAASIKPAEVSAWFLEMGFTAPTQNRYRAAMSKAYKLAIQNGKVTVNPVRLVTQKKESVGRLRYLTDEEETRLRMALVTRPWAVPHLDIALNTGMRRGEQFRLTWDDVDLDNKHIHLSMTKNGSSRYVSLNTGAINALQALKAEHLRLGIPEGSPLFLNRQHKPIADPREWFRNACEEAKIKGVTWHTLRHTFASRLVMKGVGLKTVQELMGHKTIAMTARYAHLSTAHKLDALEMLV